MAKSYTVITKIANLINLVTQLHVPKRTITEFYVTLML